MNARCSSDKDGPVKSSSGTVSANPADEQNADAVNTAAAQQITDLPFIAYPPFSLITVPVSHRHAAVQPAAGAVCSVAVMSEILISATPFLTAAFRLLFILYTNCRQSAICSVKIYINAQIRKAEMQHISENGTPPLRSERGCNI